MDSKTLLLLTYHFPPSAAVAVYRMLGFVRYLPTFGWRTVVGRPLRLSAETMSRRWVAVRAASASARPLTSANVSVVFERKTALLRARNSGEESSIGIVFHGQRCPREDRRGHQGQFGK